MHNTMKPLQHQKSLETKKNSSYRKNCIPIYHVHIEMHGSRIHK